MIYVKARNVRLTYNGRYVRGHCGNRLLRRSWGSRCLNSCCRVASVAPVAALLAPFQDQPLNQVTVRTAGLEVGLKSLKEFARRGHVSALCRHSVHQVAPVGNDLLGSRNQPIGVLKLLRPQALVIEPAPGACVTRPRGHRRAAPDPMPKNFLGLGDQRLEFGQAGRCGWLFKMREPYATTVWICDHNLHLFKRVPQKWRAPWHPSGTIVQPSVRREQSGFYLKRGVGFSLSRKG